MIVIGLTGGIGAGKTSVVERLNSLGAEIFDADVAARVAVAKGTRGYKKAVAYFGQYLLLDNKELNRQALAKIVFTDEKARRVLEEIVHEEVWAMAESFLKKCKAQNTKVAVLEIPLLIESGWHKRVDEVWVVALPVDKQIERVKLRSGLSKKDVEARIAVQMSLEEKKKYADVIIDNSGTWEETDKQILKAWERLKK
ncbi:MAG TPA: dephospho-CoA kinase [Candidatus Avacidaminococcus intestinavium]|uniref:Dephospho-CoA kinase n=1 Tax=Candidatus Avacidaminococcus intestinavium TaxID=2840684 RepID=A0A9D1SL75_9FIRM|nr:dephospho-CoA kinase [Candidatus Avacidaminococcus intestinavium]